jgi:hypothetical protein
MKTMHIKKHFPLLGLLLLLLNSACGWAEELGSSKKKEINQSFSVSLSDQLNVDNRYGSITVTHWEKNEVAIRVVIESKSTNDNRAQQGLDRVQIELKKSGNTVYALTTLKNHLGINNNRLTIDYYISMPSKLTAFISQQYGNINMPGMNEGKCTLEVAYGNVKAGSFTEPLAVSAKYSNINLEDVEDLRMELSYCGSASLGSGQSITVDSRYSNLKLRNVDKLRVDKRYGSLTVENAKNVAVEMRYSEARIDNVTEELNISALDYSTLTVRKLDAGFKSVSAEAHYGTLKLSIPTQAAFRVTAEAMKYGKVDISGLKVTNSSVENKVDRYYQINGGGNSHIRFDGNSYSSLRINAL